MHGQVHGLREATAAYWAVMLLWSRAQTVGMATRGGCDGEFTVVGAARAARRVVVLKQKQFIQDSTQTVQTLTCGKVSLNHMINGKVMLLDKSRLSILTSSSNERLHVVASLAQY